MIKILRYCLFLLLPILLFLISHFLKKVQGYYYYNLYDPSYVYLTNSLNLAQGSEVGHLDHPGTPVQLMGAAFIRIYYFFSDQKEELVNDVLSNPEEYLNFMNSVFVVINCLLLFFLGLFVFKITKNLILGLFIQISPFTSTSILYGLTVVAPEVLLISVSIILIGILIFYLYRAKELVSLWFILIFAVVCAFGLAVKLSFFPFLLLPLTIIKKIKHKLLFLLTTFVLFLLFAFPIVLNYSFFLGWIKSLILFSGLYGKGEPVILNYSDFLNNLQSIFIYDYFFVIIYLLSILMLVVRFFAKNKIQKNTERFKKENLLLFALLIVITLQILITAKHFKQYYLLPSFMMSTFLMYIVYSMVGYSFGYSFKKFNLNYFLGVTGIITLIWCYVQFRSVYDLRNDFQTETVKVIEFINNNYNDSLVVHTFQSANKDCALALGAGYSARSESTYRSILSTQKNNIFYNPWGKRFSSFVSKEDARRVIENKDFIVLHIGIFGTAEDFKKLIEDTSGKHFGYKKVFSNKYSENIYEFYVENKQ